MVCGKVFRIMCLTTPVCQHARVIPFNHLGHTTQLLCGQSALAPGQGSEHYLVAFYDKHSATSGLFFCHPVGPAGGFRIIECIL